MAENVFAARLFRSVKRYFVLTSGEDTTETEHPCEDWTVSSSLSICCFAQGRLTNVSKRAKYTLLCKGNELRSLLLFAYPIFEDVLSLHYYSQFLLLVLIMHLSESRALHRDWLDNLSHLCTQFVLMFPRLYSGRHNVQVVHSIVHVADTVKAFGPLSNSSTFNFESLLGLWNFFIYWYPKKN